MSTPRRRLRVVRTRRRPELRIDTVLRFGRLGRYGYDGGRVGVDAHSLLSKLDSNIESGGGDHTASKDWTTITGRPSCTINLTGWASRSTSPLDKP